MSVSQPMNLPDDTGPAKAPVTYRYPAAYRVQALFGAGVFALIIGGSVLAALAALQANRPVVVLYGASVVVGLIVVVLGLDIGSRTITATAQGLQTKWLRASSVAWSDVIGWHYLPLNLIHIRLKRGSGWYVWPILERYTDLLTTIDDKVKG